MAEADPEDRDAAEQLAHDLDLRATSGSGSPGPFERRTPSKRASSSAARRVRDDRHGRSRRRRGGAKIERFAP